MLTQLGKYVCITNVQTNIKPNHNHKFRHFISALDSEIKNAQSSPSIISLLTHSAIIFKTFHFQWLISLPTAFVHTDIPSITNNTVDDSRYHIKEHLLNSLIIFTYFFTEEKLWRDQPLFRLSFFMLAPRTATRNIPAASTWTLTHSFQSIDWSTGRHVISKKTCTAMQSVL